MLILGIHSGPHDSTACLFDEYRLLAAVSQERLTRVKGDGGHVPLEAIDECLTIAQRGREDVDAIALGRSLFSERYYLYPTLARLGTRPLRRALGREKQRYMLGECRRYRTTDSLSLFDAPRFLADHGFRPDAQISFSNHHLAHALPCLFHTDWPEALLYTADGRGDNAQYSIRLFGHGRLETLYGGDEELLLPPRVDGLGEVYSIATEVLGFTRNRHEGKLNGLAAYGKPVLFDALASHFKVDDSGQIHSDFPTYEAMEQCIVRLARHKLREDVAASVQHLLEVFVVDSLSRVLRRHPRRFLGLSGGVFANVRLNQRLAEELPVDEVFIFPAMSDQGQPYGGVLDFLLRRDGLERWLAIVTASIRCIVAAISAPAIDERLGGDPAFRQISTSSVETSAGAAQEGGIVAIYTRGMEYGPRALGARTIMAARPRCADQPDPERPPFAQRVHALRAGGDGRGCARRVFDLGPAKRYAARFMTITCGVREGLARAHSSGGACRRHGATAGDRAQQNPLYYDILAAYKALSGVPVLVNTSFNVHEEPIINSPEECAQALVNDRIDFVVTEQAVYARS